MKSDLDGTVKKKRATSGFVLKVMIGGSLFISGTCTLHICYGTISNIS